MVFSLAVGFLCLELLTGLLSTESLALPDTLWASQVVLVLKNLPASAGEPETGIRPLGREDPPEEGMATHSSILAWRIPWQRSLVGYSPWCCKESGHDWGDLAHTHAVLYYLIYISGLKNTAVSYKKAYLTNFAYLYFFRSFVTPSSSYLLCKVIYTGLGEFSLFSVRKTAQSTWQFPACSPFLPHSADQQR